jgi:uncharacterized protein (TIGR03067 family)
MRPTSILLLLLTVLVCGGSTNSPDKSRRFNGMWKPVRQEIGGTVLPLTAYEKQKLILKDSTYTVIAESTDKGIVIYHNGKMDIYGKEGVNAGKHFTAIYKYEKKQLTVCYNLMGDSYPETFETIGKPAFFLSVFMRSKVK